MQFENSQSSELKKVIFQFTRVILMMMGRRADKGQTQSCFSSVSRTHVFASAYNDTGRLTVCLAAFQHPGHDGVL